MSASESRPVLLSRARLLDPSTGRDGIGGLFVMGGIVREIGPGVDAALAPEGTEIIDCGGKLVCPGLVDLQAFLGEPGAAYRETIATASLAAAAGGITTVVSTPDTTPPVDDPAIVDFLLRRARDTAIVHVHPMAAITKGLQGREMTEFGLLREAGAVAFSDGPRSIANARVLSLALTYAGDFDALIVHHTEDADLAGDGVMNEGELASRLGLGGRSTAAEAIVLERDMRLVAATGGRYHAALLTCRESLEIIRRAKSAGLPVTCATSINHLALNENDVGDYRTFFKLAPPLRAESDRQALLAAVADGTIDVIVSDHSPQDVEQKRQPFAEAADGAIGLETMFVAGLRLVHQGELDLMTLLRAMSTRPARLFQLPGGTLEPGAPADLMVVDTEVPWILDAADLKSKSKNTPFDEARFQGRVERTLVAGRTVYAYR